MEDSVQAEMKTDVNDNMNASSNSLESSMNMTMETGGMQVDGRSRGGYFRGGPRGRGGRGGRGGRNQPFDYQRMGDQRKVKSQEDRVYDRLSGIGGSTQDLPCKELTTIRKFSGHCRLFVGNLSADMKEDEFVDIFKPYGEISEPFLSVEKAFGFIKLDYRSNAERAKHELDGSIVKGRMLKVRFAAHGAALRVKNLSHFVSNELLEKAFCVFGEIEKAVVIVDSKGKSLGEGIVEFTAKPAANLALKMCGDGCFFLTQSPRPVLVEPLIQLDEDDGYPEKNMPKKNKDFILERECGPHFAKPGSFEYDYGLRWKAIFELEKQKKEALDAEMKYEREKLEEQMEYAKYEHETTLLREQLRMREEEKERQMRDHEMRQRQREESRRQEEEMYRRSTEDMTQMLQRREEEMRRRVQENTLFMQANQLNNILDQQEAAIRSGSAGADNVGGRDYTWNREQGSAAITGNGNNMPLETKQFLDSYDTQGNYESYYNQAYTHGGYEQAAAGEKSFNVGEHNARGGSWGRGDRPPREDFNGGNPMKRRRY